MILLKFQIIVKLKRCSMYTKVLRKKQTWGGAISVPSEMGGAILGPS